MSQGNFRAIVSSDWNECLSPARPFDILTFLYPELGEEIRDIFLLYTGNKLSYSGAVQRIRSRLPRPIEKEDVDSYLEREFSVYKGTVELIKWCGENDILFMLNTTGWMGYFQRLFYKNLLPSIDCLSASTFLKFEDKFPFSCVYPLEEIEDKPKNTLSVMENFGVERVVIIGDSGGDGPHFVWGRERGALLIGAMVKSSLLRYCSGCGVSIDYLVGDKEKGDIEVNKIILAIESFLNQ